MTIIATFPGYHVENHRIVYDIEDAAGEYFSADVSVDRGGRYMASSIQLNGGGSNSNSQALGPLEVALRAPVAKDPVFGDEITLFRARGLKEAGTSGTTAIAVDITIWISH